MVEFSPIVKDKPLSAVFVQADCSEESNNQRIYMIEDADSRSEREIPFVQTNLLGSLSILKQHSTHSHPPPCLIHFNTRLEALCIY